jgi:hypothetical protein
MFSTRVRHHHYHYHYHHPPLGQLRTLRPGVARVHQGLRAQGVLPLCRRRRLVLPPHPAVLPRHRHLPPHEGDALAAEAPPGECGGGATVVC